MAKAKRAGWTVMVYLCADNDLEEAAAADIEEMKRVGSTDRVNVLIQLDPRQRNKPTRRYRLQRDTPLDDDAVGTPLGETNSGDPNVLRDFAVWGMKTYPAQHYLLVIWNHGAGWDDSAIYSRLARTRRLRIVHRSQAFVSRVEETTRETLVGLVRTDDTNPRGHRRVSLTGIRHVREVASRAMFATTIDDMVIAAAIGLDNAQKDFLDNRELKAVVESLRDTLGHRIDVLGFDACWMNMAEVAYQLRLGVSLLIGSEDTTPDTGWPYDRVLRALTKKPGMTPTDLAETVVARYIGSNASERVTMSVCDLTRAPKLLRPMTALSEELTRLSRDHSGRAAITEARRRAWKSPDAHEYVDLGDFCARLRTALPDDSTARDACEEVIDAIKESGLVVKSAYRKSRRGRPTGLAIWFPDFVPVDQTIRLYKLLDFSATGWHRFLSAYNADAD